MEDTKVTVDSLHGIVLYYIITMSITIITIIFGKRFWCRYLCPMYVFNYIGMAIRNIFRLPFLGMRIDSSKCVECKKCNNACMMALPVSDMVRSNMWEYSECIMCGECINNCSKKVIRKGISK